MIELGLKVTLAYLVGAVLGSLLVGFFYGGVDIRKLGSGNAGGTNALRTQGKVFALWVMVIDIGKGILAAAVIPPLAMPGVGIDPSVDRSLVLYSVAFAAILGHVFPVWFGFRGGKGGATAAGLVCFLAPAAALPVLGSWLLIVFTTGFVGLATITASLVAVRVPGSDGVARAERLVPVRLRDGCAADLRAPRQHPPHARRHGVAVRESGGALAAPRPVARDGRTLAARLGRRPHSFGRGARARVRRHARGGLEAGRQARRLGAHGRGVRRGRVTACRAASTCSTSKRCARRSSPTSRRGSRSSTCSRSSTRRTAICWLRRRPSGELDVCVAEFQTAGRGRRGRRWNVPLGGGMCLSVGWQFAGMPAELAALTLAVGVAVRRVLERVAGLDDRAQVAERSRLRRAQARRHSARARCGSAGRRARRRRHRPQRRAAARALAVAQRLAARRRSISRPRSAASRRRAPRSRRARERARRAVRRLSAAGLRRVSQRVAVRRLPARPRRAARRRGGSVGGTALGIDADGALLVETAARRAAPRRRRRRQRAERADGGARRHRQHAHQVGDARARPAREPRQRRASRCARCRARGVRGRVAGEAAHHRRQRRGRRRRAASRRSSRHDPARRSSSSRLRPSVSACAARTRTRAGSASTVGSPC